MTWLFGLILVPLVLCFCLGAALSAAWWVWRRRSIYAEYEKRRLTAEAESDRLRLRVSSLQATEARADHLQLELEKASKETVRTPKVEGELESLRLRAALVPELENQISNLRARADEADRLEAQLAKLELSQVTEPDGSGRGTPTRSEGEQQQEDNPNGEPESHDQPEAVIDLRAYEASHRDDLQIIKGIGPVMEETLNAQGIKTWEQLAALTEHEVVSVGEAIGAFRGRIERDRWVAQAAQLIVEFPLATPYDRPTKNGRTQQK